MTIRSSYKKAVGLLADLHDELHYQDEAVDVVSALFNRDNLDVMSDVIAERTVRKMQADQQNVKPLPKSKAS